MNEQKSSRLSGFYKKTLAERLQIIGDWAELSEHERAILQQGRGFNADSADNMIENAVGVFPMPLGIATNFRINQHDYLIPMSIEEPSVLAAMSNAARLFREGGGFQTHSDEPIMIGQIQVLDIDDLDIAQRAIQANKDRIMQAADAIGGSIIKRGGGMHDVFARPFPETAIGPMLVVHLHMDTREAMGANAINTAAEHVAPLIEDLTGGRVNLRILSNLTDQRKAYAEGMVPKEQLARDGLSGDEAVQAIIEAGVFAEVDPYRAATHNKGIMNGIDAVIIATGNDWRAVEAGAHAFAARSGRYSSLSRWWRDDDGNLRGSLELPLAVGTVGGATRVHPSAQVALKILGYPTSRELSEIIAAAGLAQNFAAIRALSMEGIQQGHMRMHAKQLATAAGAAPHQVNQVAQTMIQEKTIRLERAQQLVQALNDSD